jgi:hypothetical protein
MEIKNSILVLLLIGITLIFINLYKQQNTCQDTQPQIIYKYIPRTLEEEQDDPLYPSDIFKKMFTEQTPWIISINGYDSVKNENINKYFISQT